MAEDNTLQEENPSTRMLFEPVLVISRLAQASLYPVGTKLYVRENAIYIQPPSLFQSMNRWMSGDSREDLTYLYEPIQRFIHIYKHKTTKKQREVLKNIVENSIAGLEKIRDTYGAHRIIDHSLAYYQSFLVKCIGLKTTVVPKRSPYHPPLTPSSDDEEEMTDISLPAASTSSSGSSKKKDKDRHKSKYSNERDTSVGDTSTSSSSEDKVTDKLSGVWALEDIQMLRTMIMESQSSDNDEERQSRLKTLNSFLDSKELEVKKAIDSLHRP